MSDEHVCEECVELENAWDAKQDQYMEMTDRYLEARKGWDEAKAEIKRLKTALREIGSWIDQVINPLEPKCKP